jgi:AAA15 family ATPase/GTPase
VIFSRILGLKEVISTMLIEFTVGNYRSFKEPVTLSMVAAKLTSKNKELDESNVFPVDSKLRLLKSAAIYGANASGKSNLAKALNFMRWFIINSSRETQSTDQIGVEPFRLSTETDTEPTFFEIVFVMDGQRYRYGFEATPERVISEWLFYVPKSRETLLFERTLDKITTTKVYNAEGLSRITRQNALFLSVSAQFSVKIAEKILSWVKIQLKIISGLGDKGYRGYTVDCLVNEKHKPEIVQLLKKLDFGFSDLQVEESEITADLLPKEMPDVLKRRILRDGGKMVSIQTIHRRFDKNGNFVAEELFDLDEQESEGTQKIFALVGPLIDTFKTGKVLVIDEFDARMHPLISHAIVDLFNSNETNPHNAQLIFMTHDTNLLSDKLFRRDQIWFTEKNRYGVTDLYSLAEYKIRNDEVFEKNYIKGKYGAIPLIAPLEDLMRDYA